MTTREWIHIRRSANGQLESCAELTTVAVPVTVALVDPYYGATSSVTPLEKILPSLPAAAADVDAIVLRGVPLETLLDGAGELVDVLRDRWGRSIELGALAGGSDNGGRRLAYSHVGGIRWGLDELLPQLRQLELRAQVRRAGVLYRPSSAHILLPSGAHADAYIRVVDLFDDYTAVRRVADWLDHRVDEQTVLVADSWTILPLLQELNHRRVMRSGAQKEARPPILSFVAYPDPDELRNLLETVSGLMVARPEGRVLFILSAASSGGLLGNLRLQWERFLPGIGLDVVAIVNTDSTIPVESLCSVTGIARFPADNCELCKSGITSALIRIDRKRYFPDLRPRRDAEMITPAAAEEHKEFWQIANSCNAIHLHAHVPEGSPLTIREGGEGAPSVTHRDIAIDVVALLENAHFAESVRESLSKFARRCDLLIVPSHHATDALTKLAKSLYPDLAVVNVEKGWVERLRPALYNRRHILILDDAVVSGRTLRSIHRVVQDQIHLLSADERPVEGYRISAFAVIGRPHSDSLWTRLSDSLRQSSSAPSLECHRKLLMPDRGCPWCDEVNRLDNLRKLIRSTPTLLGSVVALAPAEREMLDSIDARLDLLTLPQSGVITGLRDSIFICGPDGRMNGRKPDRLTPHSLFGEDLSEATAYAAVATTMHGIRLQARARMESKQATTWEWDVARIVTAFHDPIIQASFLRSARSDELRLERSKELSDAVREALYVLQDPERRVSPMLAAEHTWAAVGQKFPPLIRPLFLDGAKSVLADHAEREGGMHVSRLIRFLDGLKRHMILPVAEARPS